MRYAPQPDRFIIDSYKGIISVFGAAGTMI